MAPDVEAHFARHAAEARRRGLQRVAPVPDASAIAAMLEAAFWASLRREEGYIPKISLAYLSPEDAIDPLRLERPLPLDPAALTRVAPAVERAGIHLGVWREGDQLRVWGTTRAMPAAAFVLEVAAPGLLVVKHQRDEESGKYVNVAVIEGNQIKLVDERASTMQDCPALLTTLLGSDDPDSWLDGTNVLVLLAVSMRAHGRGGLLLVVPERDELWRDSIVRPISYPVRPPFAALAALVPGAPDDAHVSGQEALHRAVDVVAGLTAVDGATVVTRTYELLAFGAKIARRKGSTPVEQIAVSEPVRGGVAAVMHPAHLGGTRHLSAAQFVHDQRETLALVASQDGRFTIFAWSSSEQMVHAHRIEALLL